MKTYTIKIKHDAGIVTLLVQAFSLEGAIQTAMNSENCPRGAILSAKTQAGGEIVIHV